MLNVIELPQELYGKTSKVSHYLDSWGDFNTILHTNENQGGIINSPGPIKDFNDMIFHSGLIDPEFKG